MQLNETASEFKYVSRSYITNCTNICKESGALTMKSNLKIKIYILKKFKRRLGV